MYGTPHVAVAATAVLWLNLANPIASFAVGWGTHYLLDTVPHGDEHYFGKNIPADVRQRRLATLVTIDALVIIGLWYRRKQKYGPSLPVTAAIIGAVAPDVLQAGFRLLGFRGFPGPLGWFHAACHNPLDIRLPFWFGLAYQVLMAFLLWRWLLMSGGPSPIRKGEDCNDATN